MINSVSVTVVNVLLHKACLLLFYLVLLIFSVVVRAEESLCVIRESGIQVSIRYINDGDTLTVEDNSRIRIIGINTPELGHNDKPDQPLAVLARERLQSYLRSNRALIVYDEERRDKYGRILVHVFDEQRNNVAAKLIREGLGFAVSIPPNLRYRECYLDAAEQAYRAQKGVWTEPYYDPIAVDNLRHSGFMRVQACIQSIRKYRNTTYLYLSNRFRLLIADENRHYFEPSPIVFKKDLCLIATGWVYDRHSYKAMKLLHPDSVRITH